MDIRRFLHEVMRAGYYRTRPFEVARYGYAKWLYSRHRLEDPKELLRGLDIDPEAALVGFEEWRPEFEAALNRVRERGGEQGGVSMEDGVVLYGITRALRPKVVIETGVAAGISTGFIGAAMIENGSGELFSIELPEADWAAPQSDGNHFDWPSTGVGWATPRPVLEGLGRRRHLVLEDVRTSLPRLLEKLGKIDLFFHDDLHLPDHMRWEYETVWPYLRENGILASDDADFGWVSFCQERQLGRKAYRNVQRLTAIRKPSRRGASQDGNAAIELAS